MEGDRGARVRPGTRPALASVAYRYAGVAGGEYGIRGFIAALDVNTGKEAWRFYTIPGPGEPGHDTWSGDSWMHGGAPIWATGSYDPETNLTYWGTGNGSPWFGLSKGRRRLSQGIQR